MIWYILLAILVYFTITIVCPVVLYKVGILKPRDMEDALGVWAGILWPITLTCILIWGTFRTVQTLIQKFANVK